MTDEQFMELAIEEAKAAPACEVPVGAVIVREGKVVARGHNLRESTKDATAHAEIVAIRAACEALSGWNLSGCTLYVTLEPCPMCAGAIRQSHISRIVFGAYDPKGGAAGSVCDIFAMPYPGRQTVKGGVLEEPCGELIRRFFAESVRESEKNPCNL
ncbi:tRNA-specific adenosine deaminase [bioreactor metagenome]|uniref:tRNA-specific adenosine deaminase 2 n=1 Tax=bioreactor metagenome TaxID=1076179 RepID=A0A644XXZ4_9ZZZZ